MKLVRLITVLLLIAAAAFWGVSYLTRQAASDDTYPTISCPSDTLVLSVNDNSRKTLCAGVTAYDEKDKDLSDKIVASVTLEKNGTGTVTYLVCDNDNHVASATRPLRYTDYHAPRFYLSGDLRYSLNSSIRITDRLTAEDQLDGVISDQIKLSAVSLDPGTPGVYPVTFEVTNTTGDISTITLDVVIVESNAAQASIVLRDYIVYPENIASFNPRDYLKNTIACAEDATVSVVEPTGGYQSGVNRVTFSTKDREGRTVTTTLYVVVE